MTFGSVSHTGDRWLIRCEPHVRSRLKRVFPRAPQRAAEAIAISDTPENSRELEWFLQRYPMEVTDRARLVARAREHVDMEARLADLLAARVPPADVRMALPPRDYQVFADQVLRVRGGLLLADDVGLGKSVSGMCAMTDPAFLPALVVCPAHMPRQWAAYFARFLPSLKVHILKSGQPYPLTRQPRSRTPDLWPDRLPDVVISTYHKLRGWAETLAEVCRYAVFDECQQLRNPDSMIYDACKLVADRSTMRMGLSATPIYNYGNEFFWVVDCLLPGALGTRHEFLREWCTGANADKARIEDAEEFGSYLRREGIMLRRTRAEVGRELPPLTKVVHEIDADTAVLDSITDDAASLARIIVATHEANRGDRMNAAGQFDLIVRQATGIAKAPYVADFVRMLIDSGERVLLFGWHRAVYDIWCKKLADLKPVLYTGTESPDEKAAAVAAFTEGDARIMVMSLRSGAGVDGLQGKCRVAVFGELDWSPGVHEQCVGRLARDGQTDEVLAYYMVAADGSDPVMSDVLGIKREQIEGVRNPGGALSERINTGTGHIRALAQAFLEKRGGRG